MRIAMLSPPWIAVPPRGYGGIEWVVSLLTEELVARGHDVTLYAPGDSRTSARLVSSVPEGLMDRMHATSIDAFHTGLAWRSMLTDIADGMAPNVVHDHTSWIAPALAPTLPLPIVHTHHGAFDADNRLLHGAFADDLTRVCISQHQRASWPELPVAAVVPNAIDVAGYRIGTEKEDFLLCISRIHPTKGNHLAIFVAERIGVPLILAGKIDGVAGQQYFEKEIEPRVDGNQVRFLGEIDEDSKRDLMGRARACLFPIRWPEPFGLVMIESMAAGTPCIAFNEGAASEVIVHGETGFVVDGGIDGMVEAVHASGEIDPAKCRRHVEEHFSPGVMTDRYLAVYESVAR